MYIKARKEDQRNMLHIWDKDVSFHPLIPLLQPNYCAACGGLLCRAQTPPCLPSPCRLAGYRRGEHPPISPPPAPLLGPKLYFTPPPPLQSLTLKVKPLSLLLSGFIPLPLVGPVVFQIFPCSYI